MALRPGRWLAALVCAGVVGAAGSCHKPISHETNSYYMARTSSGDAATLGCYNSEKTGG
jgi:hypothetical protein